MNFFLVRQVGSDECFLFFRNNILMVKIVMSHCTLEKILAMRPPETDQLSLVLESIELRVNRKRYFIIDQQIVQHFVHYSKCLSNPPSFYANEIINPFLNKMILANHDKR